ncbi:MAG: bifunctional oligoribonuclease/PAP phosphatase NrnA [Flavobacteriales bacterium]|tara:strand:- start:1755 stop:2738 length:984 start_codon:yes stop_codon:yes gene_type:complete
MEKIIKALENANKIVITAHKSPDGDAIGSSLALFHYLNKLDKNVTVIVPDAFPVFLNWMEGSDKIILYDKQTAVADKVIDSAEVIFSLDYNGLNRIGDLRNPIETSSAVKIVIDHHQDPQDFADHYFVDTECCSTAQLIYEFIEKLEDLDKLDKTIGECIYCGIMTDTGSFRYPSTRSKTHRIIARFIDLGVSGSKIHQEVFDTYSEERLRLLGYALTEKMKVFPEYNAAYISLTQEELKRFSFKNGDAEGLVNYPLSIKGIKFTALITEKEGYVSLSFRSKDDFYVNKIANEHFNGGGHIYAAGGMLETSLEDAISKVESIIKKTI